MNLEFGTRVRLTRDAIERGIGIMNPKRLGRVIAKLRMKENRVMVLWDGTVTPQTYWEGNLEVLHEEVSAK
jgi:hypothetical protein